MAETYAFKVRHLMRIKTQLNPMKISQLFIAGLQKKGTTLYHVVLLGEQSKKVGGTLMESRSRADCQLTRAEAFYT